MTETKKRLREALCAAWVGHYRGWDYPGMGDSAHMGMDADDPHGADADALMPAVTAFVQEAMRDYRNHYGRAKDGAGMLDRERLARMLADDEKDDPPMWDLLSEHVRGQFLRRADRLIARDAAAREPSPPLQVER